MTVSSTTLIAQALLRAWRRHPLRAVSATLGVILGAMLATLVVSINDSVSTAANSANGIDIVKADLAVQARSAGGISYAVGRRVRAAADGSRVAAVLQVSTRRIGSNERDQDAVLSVLGVDRNAEHFFPSGTARKLIEQRAPADAPALVVGESWLKRNHLDVGSRVTLATPAGTTSRTIVGAIRGDNVPNNGAIAVGDIESVGFAFERHGVLDTIYVQSRRGIDRRTLSERLQKAAGSSATVGPPEIVGRTSARSLVIVQAMLLVAGFVGLLSAAVVVFVCWRLLLEDERASVARFRLDGATPAQLASGAGIVLLIATLASCAIGVPLGIVGARLLHNVTSQLVGFTGLAALPDPDAVMRPALAGFIGAIAIAAAAWAAGIRTFIRVPALDAVRPPDPPPPPGSPRRGLVVAGAFGLLIAAASMPWLPFELAPMALGLALTAAFLIAIALPVHLGRWIAARREGFVPLAAGRHIAADNRRTTAIIVMIGLSITAGLTLGGVAASYRAAIDRSVGSWTNADLFVRLGRPGATLKDARFPVRVQRELAKITGVAQAGAFTFMTLDHKNRNVMLQAYDTDHVEGIADLITYDGPSGIRLWEALGRGEIAISQGMARLDGLGVGSTIELPGAEGVERFRVAAVIDDYVSDGGTLVGSMHTYSRLTGDSRIDDIPLKLDPGVDPVTVTADVRAALPQYQSLTLMDRPEFRRTITGFITNVVSLFRGLAVVAFLIVLLAATMTLAASLAIRRRSLAVGQLCGASFGQIRRQLCAEVISMTAAAWLLATSVTLVLVPGTLRAMAVKSGLLPTVKFPTTELLVALPLSLIVSLVAALAVARMTLDKDIVETLHFE